MNQNSRTTNVIRNMIGGVGGQIFTSILMFVCRTYFIKLLGATYLGVNGLFSNILSMLSLAELGIGPAIVFSMYKPIADNDELHIAKLMNFYKSAYRIVACVVAVIGLALLPFLNHLIKDTGGVENLRLIFILILSNTVISYFYAYKGSMLNADQKSYITVIFRNVFAVIQNIAQIIVLIMTGNFILYLIVQIITTFLGNLIQAVYVDKKYPFLVKYKNEKIDKDERKAIMKRVQGMMMHKIGGFVLNSTDNLVLSKFVGLVAVGVYSNYLMIINLVKTYVSFFSSSISASVGNLIAKETKEKIYEIFQINFFIHFWIYTVCMVCFWTIFQTFIRFWIGSDYLIDRVTLMMVLLVFYLYGVHHAVDSFTNASGIFFETRWKPILECIINLSSSIFLAVKLGMLGVFLGSVIAYVCTAWIEWYYLYLRVFNKSVIRMIVRYVSYLAIAIISSLAIEALCGILDTESIFMNIVIRVVISVVISNAVIVGLFFNTKEFKFVLKYAKNIIRRRKK